MHASETDIESLFALQEADRASVMTQRQLDELPQKQAIADVRAQKAQLLKKKVQVQDMMVAAEDDFTKAFAEDERLAQQQQEAEAGVAEASGDFRAVEARSKALNGVVKRRRTLADELVRLEGQIDKIRPVLDQLVGVLADLDAKEQELTRSYQTEGRALQEKMLAAKLDGEQARASLDPQVAAAYDQARKRAGAVAVARLEGDACSACRTTIDAGRLLQIKADAPLSTCPSCRRLLVVEG